MSFSLLGRLPVRMGMGVGISHVTAEITWNPCSPPLMGFFLVWWPKTPCDNSSSTLSLSAFSLNQIPEKNLFKWGWGTREL
ncbi:hypothetical protein NPIL_389991 [Nephila pilipes]|uniref:Uncharacterized protein n=1 Tax=Nephila pilipes TaxID=299642 RepID=A0A8X6QR41_NEPPI|nr:hypothetical protein NPIL_389991 [Nephila pilipes]